jgi:RND family efflux transporter MFP subunit
MSRRGKIITLVLLGLIIFWRINTARNAGLEVEETESYYGKLTETVNASGEVIAENSANLSFEIAGEVTEVNFKEGDAVEKGNIIAKLDTTELYNNYLIAEATLRGAQATLDRVYDDIKDHEGDETFTQRETRTLAETAKDKAYFAYATAAKNLEGAYIRTPFDGILTLVPTNIVPGAIVSLPSSATFQVVGLETTYFRAEVDEVDINKLKSGLGAQVKIDAFPDEVFEGEVFGYNILSTTTSTGGTAYTVRVTLPENDNLRFKPGMNGDVDIIISEKDQVLLVPITAITEENDKTYVWVNDSGLAKKVQVITGGSSIDEIEITMGLKEAMRIITRPPSTIYEGVRIKGQGNLHSTIRRGLRINH